MRTDRPGEIGGGARGAQAARGRVGSSTYGNNANKPKVMTKSAIKAKEQKTADRVVKALGGKSENNVSKSKLKAADKTSKKFVTERAVVKNNKVVQDTYKDNPAKITGKAKNIKTNAKLSQLKSAYGDISDRAIRKEVSNSNKDIKNMQLEKKGQRTASPSTSKVPSKKKGK